MYFSLIAEYYFTIETWPKMILLCQISLIILLQTGIVPSTGTLSHRIAVRNT